MNGKAKFVFWWDSFDRQGTPMPFFIIVESRNGIATVGSTVSAASLLAYQIPLPLFPSYETWKRETTAKHKCFRCWATTRGDADLFRHRQIVHNEFPGVVRT